MAYGLESLIEPFLEKVVSPMLSKILPRLFSKASEDKSLSGTWKVTNLNRMSDGSELAQPRHTTIFIKQKANKLSGHSYSITITGEFPAQYKISGSIKDGLATLIYGDCIEGNRRGQSLFLLKILPDGDTMVGHRIFYGILANTNAPIKSIETTLIRER